MTDRERVDIAVIGGGGAGTMAYLRSVLNRDRTVLFMGDAETKRKGRATWVGEVDNIPGMHDLKRPITGTTATTLAWIKKQPDLDAVGRVVKAAVAKVDRADDGSDGFRIHYQGRKESGTLQASYVILATGIMDVQPLIQGSIKPIFPFANRGDVLYCIRCDGHKTIGHRLAVIGDRESAVQIAAMMQERYGHETVHILTNGKKPALSPSAQRLASVYGMTIHTSPILEALEDPGTGSLAGFRLDDGNRVSVTRAIIALGIIAYNQLLKGVDGEVDETGRAVVTDRYESTVPGFFVAGDLVAGRKMQIYTGWDGAVDAADEINRRIRIQARTARLAAAE